MHGLVVLSKDDLGLDRCGLVGWALSPKVKGHWFGSWSGHVPRLRAWSLVGVRVREAADPCFSDIDASLLFLPYSFPSLKKKKKKKILGTCQH